MNEWLFEKEKTMAAPPDEIDSTRGQFLFGLEKKWSTRNQVLDLSVRSSGSFSIAPVVEYVH